MNDSLIIGGLAVVTIGFVLIVAVVHFAWMMKDRKMRSVATGENPHDLPYVPLTGTDIGAIVVGALLLFGVLGGGVYHTAHSSVVTREAASE